MTLWWILGLSTFLGLFQLLTALANEDVHRATRAAIAAKNKVRMNGCMSVIGLLTACAVPVLWTVYTYEVNDWRFAAISWIPIAARIFVHLTIPKYGQAQQVEVKQVQTVNQVIARQNRRT